MNYSDSKLPKFLKKNFHKCKPNDLSRIELIKNGRTQIYCFDNLELDVEGFLNNKESKGFFIEISKCNNSTFSQKCKSEEEIQSFLQYKYFHFFKKIYVLAYYLGREIILRIKR